MKRRINSALLYAALARAGTDSKPAECHGNDSAEQLHRLLWIRGGGGAELRAGGFPRRLSGPPVSVGGFFGGRRFPGLGSAGPCPAPQIALGIPALFLLDRLRPMCGLACARLSAGPALSCAAVYTLAKLFRKTK